MTLDKTHADRLAEAIEDFLQHRYSPKTRNHEAIELRRKIAAYRAEQQSLPPQSVGDGELVERLRVLRADDKRTTAYDDQTIDAAISRLQSQSANPWVKIDDPSIKGHLFFKHVLGHRQGHAPASLIRPHENKGFGKYDPVASNGDEYEFVEAPIQPTHILNYNPLPIVPSKPEDGS